MDYNAMNIILFQMKYSEIEKDVIIYVQSNGIEFPFVTPETPISRPMKE